MIFASTLLVSMFSTLLPRLSQPTYQIIDLGAGIRFGNGDKHLIRAIRVIFAQVIAADDVEVIQQRLIDLADGFGTGDDEFLEEWQSRIHAIALDLRDFLRGVVRFVVAQFRDAPQS